MTKITAILSVLVAGLLALAVTSTAQDSGAATQSDANAPEAIVLGTFDSRGIALAYYRSAAFSAALKELHAQRDAAKAEGDTELVEELERRGPAMQAEAHRRTFGNASVRELLEPLDDEIAAIAKRLGVDVVVSRWDQVYRRPSTKSVDVTAALAGLFDPDEKTLQIMEELLQQAPVPLADLNSDD